MSVATDEIGVIVQASPQDLSVCPPFSTLFPIDKRKLDAITQSMREDGFDPSRPINVWRQGSIVVDGHTRREAAIAAGITDIPVCFHDFHDEDAAVVYAIRAQVDRRQLTDAEVYRVTLELDKRRPKGGDRKSETAKSITSCEVMDCRSSKETAAKLHVSPSEVEAVRTIEDHADKFPDVKEAVLNGEKSIRMAAREISDRKRKEKPAYEPVIPPPAAREDPKPSHASSVKVSDADREWLESHPLRGRVVASRFDEDALIYRRFSVALGAIRGELQQLIGLRSAEHQSILYAALLGVSPLPSINTWTVCQKCEGKGGKCRPCRGGGYVVPGM